MNTKNLTVSSIEDLVMELDQTISNEFQPTVGIVFSAPELPYQELPALFQARDIELIGCTTMGEICDKEIKSDCMIVMLMDMKKEDFTMIALDGEEKDIYSQADVLGQNAVAAFANPGLLVFTGGITIDGNKLVTQIKESINKEIPIYGGLAGDGTRFQTTYCFSQSGHKSLGLVAMIIDTDKIQISGLSYSGWEELGATHKITKAIGNVVYEINGKPAADEFEKYFGKLRYNWSTENEEEFEVIAGQFPLKIMKQEGVSVLRSVLVHDIEKKSLTLAGGVQEGEQFKFCTTPSFEVVDKTIERFAELKKETGEVDAVIMVSCAARLTVFGPMLEDEVSGIYNYWKKPMVGLFAYGEIGSANLGNKNCEFHNVTCSIVTLTEK